MIKPTLMIFAAAALLAIHGNAAMAATQAGVSAAVRGEIDLAPVSGQATHQTASGEDVYLGDGITSHDDAGMQLMLLDETVFTIGANTEMTIDEFVYDPATGAGAVTASVAKGVFRFVTGNIAQGDPEDMKINLPVGTIGIRGTIGAASMIGGIALVVLLGPGPDNNADARRGHLEVSAEGVTVDLTRPRWGTIIEPGQPPTPPALFSDAQINGILNALGSVPPDQEPSDPVDDGVATTLANQDLADTVSFVQQDLAEELVVPVDEATLDPLNPFGSLTTFTQLNGLSGSGAYGGVLPSSPQFAFGGVNDSNNHYKIQLEIDFDSRTIGGVGSDVFFESDIVGNGNFEIDIQNFSNAIGESFDIAAFLIEEAIFLCGSENCIAAVAVVLNGSSAGSAFHALAVENLDQDTFAVGVGESSGSFSP